MLSIRDNMIQAQLRPIVPPTHDDIKEFPLIGFNALQHSDEAGDFYVAPDGHDTNAGTAVSPFRTINRAVVQAADAVGKRIVLRAGIYREEVTMQAGSEGNRLTLARHGLERVEVTGFDVLVGTEPCTVADRPEVGNAFAEFHKVTISKSAIAGGNPRAANLHENGQRMRHVLKRRINPQFPDSELATQDWLMASKTVTGTGLRLQSITVNFQVGEILTTATGTAIVQYIDGDYLVIRKIGGAFSSWQSVTGNWGGHAEIHSDEFTVIRGYQLPEFTDDYTIAQFENTDVLFHRHPNSNERSTVDHFDADTKTIYLTEQRWKYEDNNNRDRFALANLLPATEPGGWGFVDHGATVTLYYRPADAGNQVEFSARGKVINADASHIELEGIIVSGASSVGTGTDNLYAFDCGNVNARENLVLNNVLFKGNYRAAGGRAPVHLRNVSRFQAKNVTVAGGPGQNGFQISGDGFSPATELPNSTDVQIQNCLVHDVDYAGVRLSGVHDTLIYRSKFRGNGRDAHANQATIYQRCHNVWFFGCDFQTCRGYLPWQGSSGVSFLMNIVPVTPTANNGRGLFDQSKPSILSPQQQAPSIWRGTGKLMCNTVLPWGEALAYTNGLSAGYATETEARYDVAGNLTHGLSVLAANRGQIEGNMTTSGSGIDASDIEAAYFVVYEDVIAGDYRIKADSPSRTAAPVDISPAISALEAQWPLLDFRHDIVGTPFNPAAAPVSGVADPDIQPSVQASWIKRPVVQGSPVVGSELTIAAGVLAALPRPTISAQWVRSTDGVIWQDIPDETGGAYTLVAGDAGYYVTRRETPNDGGTPVYAEISTQISASFPITNPAQFVLHTDSGTLSQRETATFTSNGNPLLVVVAQRNDSNADNTLTVTVGAAGRTAGSGTAVPVFQQARRTSNETHICFQAVPPSGEVTVQVGGSLASHSSCIAVYEVGGVAGIGAVASQGNSSTNNLSQDVTTTAEDSLALYIWNYFYRDGAPTEISGAEALLDTDTGDTDNYSDLAVAIGFEQVPVSGTSLEATASWVTNSTVTALALELLS